MVEETCEMGLEVVVCIGGGGGGDGLKEDCVNVDN